jgi:hypothetical protein
MGSSTAGRARKPYCRAGGRTRLLSEQDQVVVGPELEARGGKSFGTGSPGTHQHLLARTQRIRAAIVAYATVQLVLLL